MSDGLVLDIPSSGSGELPFPDDSWINDLPPDPIIESVPRDYEEFSRSRELGVSLFPYQREGFVKTCRYFFDDGNASGLTVMPTGTGKTIYAAAFSRYCIDAMGFRGLFLAHTDELIQQAARKMGVVNLDVAIEKAESHALRELECGSSLISGKPIRMVVASVQSLRGKRLLSWPSNSFDFIICDECHHGAATSYQNIFKHFSSARILGLTATPKRTDGSNVAKTFRGLVFEYPFLQAVTDRYCARPIGRRGNVRVDLRGLKSIGGDFNAGELDERIRAHLTPLVNAVYENCGNQKTLVFTPDIRSAEAFAEALNRIGISARSIHGLHPQRRQIIEAFANGEFQVLCNCQVLTEGFDDPSIRCIVLARPTQSDSLLRQMIGRGTRICNGKTECLILDFDWQVEEGKLARPIDLVIPRGKDPRIDAIANRIWESRDGDVDLLDLADEAGSVKADEDERRTREVPSHLPVLRRLSDNLPVSKMPTGIEWQTFDPLGCDVSLLANVRVDEDWLSINQLASEKQKAALIRFGTSEAEASRMTRKKASAMMDWFVTRAKAKMATLKQARLLMSKGGYSHDDAFAMSFSEASSIIDRIFAGKHRKKGG
jgi:superfamily II DNA or RNA helicase